MTGRRERGTTLVEYMVGSLIGLLVGAALFSALRATGESQHLVLNQSNATANARTAVDTIVDGLRGCAAITAATTTGVSFRTNDGTVIRYWQSGTNLVRSVNGVPSTGTVVLTGVETVRLTYGMWDGSYWTFSTAPWDLATVATVRVRVTTNVRGFTRLVRGTVRLRQRRCTISGTTKTF